MCILARRDYIKDMVSNFEERLTKMVMKQPNNFTTPITNNCITKWDESDELEHSELTMYQELIGDIRCVLWIERVDIIQGVAVLSAFQESPQKGHPENLSIRILSEENPQLNLYFHPNTQILIQTPSNESSRKHSNINIVHAPSKRGRPVSQTSFFCDLRN